MAKRNWLTRTGADVFRTLRIWGKAIRGQRYAVTTVNSNGVEVVRLVDYETYCEEGYKRNAVVYASVREIARTAPSARLQVHRRLTRGQTEIFEDSPLQAILDMPNPRQSHYDFVEMLLTYLNLDGNAFILRERRDGPRGETIAMWLPRPDKMTPVIDTRRQAYDEGALLGHSYMLQTGEKVLFMPEQVIHIKYPDPNDRYHGLGRGIPPLMAAAYDVDNDNSQTTFIKQFFKNGAVPSGIIKSRNILDDSEVKRIQNRISEQYAGEQNWHKMMVLDADAEYQRTGLNLSEMVFPDLRAISETRICAAFKVPPVLIGVKAGLDAATYSNYALARRALWEDNIIPTTTKLAEALTRAFLGELEEDTLILPDYSQVVALQDDRTNRFARSNQAILGGWITVNEARREVGLGPLPEGVGDVLYRPLMVEAIDDGPGDASMKVLKSQVVKVRPAPQSRSHDPDTALMSSEGSSAGEIATSPVGLLAMTKKSEEEKAAHEALGEIVWKRFDRIARAWEKKFQDKAVEIFGKEARGVEAAIRSEKGQSIKAIDYDAIRKAIEAWLAAHGLSAWADGFMPLMLGLTNDQVAEWVAALGVDWGIENPAVEAFIRQYSFRFAEMVGETTREKIRGMMSAAQDEGWSITKMIDEIQSIYGGWSETRAEMIARSETIRSSNAGQVEAFRQTGVVEHEWYASPDERTCPFCAEMHGQKIAVGGVWQPEGAEMVVSGQRLVMSYGDVLYPPLHPACRCTTMAVLGD